MVFFRFFGWLKTKKKTSALEDYGVTTSRLGEA